MRGVKIFLLAFFVAIMFLFACRNAPDDSGSVQGTSGGSIPADSIKPAASGLKGKNPGAPYSSDTIVNPVTDTSKKKKQ